MLCGFSVTCHVTEPEIGISVERIYISPAYSVLAGAINPTTTLSIVRIITQQVVTARPHRCRLVWWSSCELRSMRMMVCRRKTTHCICEKQSRNPGAHSGRTERARARERESGPKLVASNYIWRNPLWALGCSGRKATELVLA